MPTTAGPRRRADAERNIDAIVAAALELFGRRANPTMTEIARAAGVGRVTLYAHFPSRDVLLEAVVERALTETSHALDGLDLDAAPADEALGRLVRSAWKILDRHRRLHAVAATELGEKHLRRRHESTLTQVDRLVARGQEDGVFRTDLPRGWLLTVFYSLMHAAADEVDAGRLAARDVPDVLDATLLPLLAAR